MTGLEPLKRDSGNRPGHAARSVALGLLLLCGCDVGPAYVAPVIAAPAAFKERAAAQGWQPAEPQDAALKGTWWTIFHEPELDGLEDRLNINNQTIAQYFQNFMAARAQVSQALAGYYPTLGAAPAASRAGSGGAASATGKGADGNQFSLPFEISWAPDLWDRVGNTVREYRFAAQVSAADLENERLTEQAALAAYYLELRGQDGLQSAYDRAVAADRTALALIRALYDTGVDGEQAVALAEDTLANAEAASAGIAINRARYEHAIATLIGIAPADFSLAVKPLETPLPAIPLAIPSELLQRRPDIAAAERTMAAANAAIGVEVAAFYPTVTLSGDIGLGASSLARLFTLPARLWSLGGVASQTIFDGGLRTATVAQYTALYNADVAAYRQTVLTAFQQVEDSLAALQGLSRQIARQQTAIDAAQRALVLAIAQYQTGTSSYLGVLSAQTALVSDQLTLIGLRTTEMTTAVQLIQALGGGWDVGQLPDGSRLSSE